MNFIHHSDISLLRQLLRCTSWWLHNDALSQALFSRMYALLLVERQPAGCSSILADLLSASVSATQGHGRPALEVLMSHPSVTPYGFYSPLLFKRIANSSELQITLAFIKAPHLLLFYHLTLSSLSLLHVPWSLPLLNPPTPIWYSMSTTRIKNTHLTSSII